MEEYLPSRDVQGPLRNKAAAGYIPVLFQEIVGPWTVADWGLRLVEDVEEGGEAEKEGGSFLLWNSYCCGIGSVVVKVAQ